MRDLRLHKVGAEISLAYDVTRVINIVAHNPRLSLIPLLMSYISPLLHVRDAFDMRRAPPANRTLPQEQGHTRLGVEYINSDLQMTKLRYFAFQFKRTICVIMFPPSASLQAQVSRSCTRQPLPLNPSGEVPFRQNRIQAPRSYCNVYLRRIFQSA